MTKRTPHRKQLQLNIEAAVDPVHKLLSSLRTHGDTYERTADLVRNILERDDQKQRRKSERKKRAA